MVDKMTLARPYARAIFEIAQANRYDTWSNTLSLLETLIADPRVNRWVNDLTISVDRLAEFLMAVVGPELDDQGKNLIKTLAVKRRFSLVSCIAKLYEGLRANAENRLTIEWESATPLDGQQLTKVSTLLGARWGKTVNLNTRINPTLMAGFRMKMGDKVIDGSVKGRLEQLKKVMGE